MNSKADMLVRLRKLTKLDYHDFRDAIRRLECVGSFTPEECERSLRALNAIPHISIHSLNYGLALHVAQKAVPTASWSVSYSAPCKTYFVSLGDEAIVDAQCPALALMLAAYSSLLLPGLTTLPPGFDLDQPGDELMVTKMVEERDRHGESS